MTDFWMRIVATAALVTLRTFALLIGLLGAALGRRGRSARAGAAFIAP